jgi:hypothetical protein
MNRSQYLLIKLSEECAEISQEALKQVQFGKDSIPPTTGSYPEGIPNHERLRNELVDLKVIVKMLEEVGEIDDLSFEQELKKMRAKRTKLERYYRISQNLGTVEKNICVRCNVGHDNDGDGDCAVCSTVPDSHMPLRG